MRHIEKPAYLAVMAFSVTAFSWLSYLMELNYLVVVGLMGNILIFITAFKNSKDIFNEGFLVQMIKNKK